jgi:hypothetical protein
VVPAHNEETQIVRVIETMPAGGFCQDVFLVDEGEKHHPRFPFAGLFLFFWMDISRSPRPVFFSDFILLARLRTDFLDQRSGGLFFVHQRESLFIPVRHVIRHKEPR